MHLLRAVDSLVCLTALVSCSTAPDPSHGLFPVSQNGRWGYIDSQGRMAIEPRFESAEEFFEDLAIVTVDAKQGAIDRRGEVTPGTHRGPGGGRDGAQQFLLMHPAGQGGHPAHGVTVGDDRTEPVAAAAVEKGDRGRRGDRQITLLTAGGTEVQTR